MFISYPGKLGGSDFVLLVIETKVYTSSHRHDRIVSGQWKRGSGLTEDCSVSPPPPPFPHLKMVSLIPWAVLRLTQCPGSDWLTERVCCRSYFLSSHF